MVTANDLMLKALNKAFAAAEQVSDPVSKAQVYTGLVHACVAAMTTKEPVGGTEDQVPPKGDQVPKGGDEPIKGDEKKELLKGTETKTDKVPPKGTKKVEPPKGTEEEPAEGEINEPVKGTPKEVPKGGDDNKPTEGDTEPSPGNEEDDDDDWTPRMMDKYKNEIDSLNKVYKFYIKHGEGDVFRQALEECTEGNMHTIQDVTPSCVRMVVAFFRDWVQKQREL